MIDDKAKDASFKGKSEEWMAHLNVFRVNTQVPKDCLSAVKITKTL